MRYRVNSEEDSEDVENTFRVVVRVLRTQQQPASGNKRPLRGNSQSGDAERHRRQKSDCKCRLAKPRSQQNRGLGITDGPGEEMQRTVHLMLSS